MSAPARMASLAGALRTVSGFVLLGTLLIAPLNYGSTRLFPLQLLLALVATAGAVWLLSIGLARSWPEFPLPVWAGLGLITVTLVGWFWMQSVPALPSFTASHLSRIAARWPHSVVPRDAALLCAWSVAAVVSLLALIDLARDAVWRRAIAASVSLTGASVALLGLLQNATGARGIYWETSPRMPGAFFGPFFHHTSAGGYLNTVWPVGLGLALAGLHGDFPAAKWRGAAFASLGAVILVLVAHAAHVSRFPQVIAAVALIGFVLWTRAWQVLGRMRSGRVSLTAAIIAVAVAAVSLGATRIGTIASRWNLVQVEGLVGGQPAVNRPAPSEWPRLMRDDLFVPSDHRDYPLGDRGAAYAAALAAIAERPWFGWGPAGWTAAAAAHSMDPFVRTFFLYVQFTHQDLLQTLVEWGVVGALGWILLVPCAMVSALRRLRLAPSMDYVGAGAAIGLGAVCVQSAIDFPLQIPAIQFNAIALAALAWTVPVARIPRVGVFSPSPP